MPDEEFIKSYTDENIMLGSLKLFFTDLIENHSSEKMDFQISEDECWLEADTGKRVLKVFGYPAAGEIAKVLEKNGIIKIKGDIIRIGMVRQRLIGPDLPTICSGTVSLVS